MVCTLVAFLLRFDVYLSFLEACVCVVRFASQLMPTVRSVILCADRVGGVIGLPRSSEHIDRHSS